MNLGSQIDVVAGIYDDNFIDEYGIRTVWLEDKKISFAVTLSSSLAEKNGILPEDLRESGVMFIRKGWNEYIDELRSACEKAGVKVTEFNFFNLAAFNEAVKQNVPIIAISGWENVHPLLKIVPAQAVVTVPYGIMYSPEPSKQVKQFIKTVETIVNKE